MNSQNIQETPNNTYEFSYHPEPTHQTGSFNVIVWVLFALIIGYSGIIFSAWAESTGNITGNTCEYMMAFYVFYGISFGALIEWTRSYFLS